jgi:DNA-binding MarR family transcriptional regulator
LVAQAQSPRGPGSKRSRFAPGQHEVVRVDPDFEDEYPDADASCTEAYATLLVAGNVLAAEHERRIEHTLGVSESVAQALAVVDGAGRPLTPTEISERTLVASATMTAVLDTLEGQGWIRRTPNPDDRRSLLIEITPEGRELADRFIPGLHIVERRVMSALTRRERHRLLALLGKVLASANGLADEPVEPLEGERRRPDRLG